MAVLWAVEDLTRTGEIYAGSAAVPQEREDTDESAIKIVEGYGIQYFGVKYN